METRIRTRLSPAEGRRFGLVVAAAFAALTILLWWRQHQMFAILTAALGLFFLLGGMLVPGRMGPVHTAWMGVALRISAVTTPVILGILFFLVITPFGVAARILGYRPLTRRGRASAWMERGPGTRRSDLHRQF